MVDLGGNDTEPVAITGSGEVVGYFYPVGSEDAFSYSNGTFSDLGAMGGTNANAESVNNAGEIVGGTSQSGSSNENAYIYSGGQTSYVPGVDGDASGVNDQGVVVGTSSGDAYIYSNGQLTSLGAMGGTASFATGVNDSNQVVGEIRDSSGNSTAFLYTAGTSISLTQVGWTFSAARGINNSGQIAGVFQDSSATGAFLYSAGTYTNLGSLGGTDGQAFGLNDLGMVVGYSATAAGVDDAFLYSGNTIEDLNTVYSSLLVSGSNSQAGFTSLSVAKAINDSGDITGTGNYWNGSSSSTEAFLLEPAAVPEPSLWIMTLSGFSFLMLARSFVRLA